MASSYFKLKIIKAQKKSSKLKNIGEKRKVTAQDKNSSATTCSHKCRICLLEGSHTIFTDLPENTLMSIIYHGGIQIDDKDCLPKYICSSCYTLLQSAILFRTKAQDTDEMLRKELNDNILMDCQDKCDNISDLSYEPDLQSLESDSENISNQKQDLSCKSCKLNFPNLNDLKLHRNSKHKGLRIQCSLCNSVLTLNSFKKHLARHQSATHIVCEVCGKLYRKDNLVKHLKLHTFNLPFQCKICPYRGRLLQTLKIHVLTHSNEKPFLCEKCNLRFLTKSNLNRHLLIHSKDKPFKCTECCRKFYTKKDLAKHAVDHTNIKNFVCDVCNNKYSSRKSLMQHEVRVHKRKKRAKGRTPLYLQAEYRKGLQEKLYSVENG